MADERPYTNNKFRVEIEGQEVKYVKRVTGMDSKTDVKELRTGNKPVEYRPGKTTYADISIERFIVDKDQTLKKWWDEYKEGKTKVTRKSGSIIVLQDVLDLVQDAEFTRVNRLRTATGVVIVDGIPDDTGQADQQGYDESEQAPFECVPHGYVTSCRRGINIRSRISERRVGIQHR